MSNYQLLINGDLKSGSGEDVEVINPANEEIVATIKVASRDDAELAIQSAKSAFPKWSKTDIKLRQKALENLADALAENQEELARLLTQEQGKPLAESIGEVAWSEGYLRHYATLDVPVRTIQDDADGYIEVRRKPLGVIAGIVPWNFPLLTALWKIGPATLAGNTIVLKTAPTTPLTTLLMGKYCRDIFPAGVVNILTDQNDLGPYLTSHPDVAKVGFTGSTQTGKAIVNSAASTLKRITLELGGNDAAIVLEDVDVPDVAEKIFGAAFINCGQACVAVKRVYAHTSIYDELCDKLSDLATSAVVGDGLNQGTQIGPLQNKAQFEKVQAFIEAARTEGTITTGGATADGKGYFIQPTIVRDVEDGAKIVEEEQFGPVLPILKYEQIDDAINRANDSPYGLGGSVWTSDREKGIEIADRIESGAVWINQHLAIGPHIPMAGFKQSGLGVEQSLEGLEEYTQIHVINYAP